MSTSRESEVSEKRVIYVAQIRHEPDGQWFDERTLYGEADAEREAEMSLLREEPELAGYEIRAVRRTEEVLDL